MAQVVGPHEGLRMVPVDNWGCRMNTKLSQIENSLKVKQKLDTTVSHEALHLHILRGSSSSRCDGLRWEEEEEEEVP